MKKLIYEERKKIYDGNKEERTKNKKAVEDAIARGNRHMREKNDLAKHTKVLEEKHTALQYRVTMLELAVADANKRAKAAQFDKKRFESISLQMARLEAKMHTMRPRDKKWVRLLLIDAEVVAMTATRLS